MKYKGKRQNLCDTAENWKVVKEIKDYTIKYTY